MAWYWCRDRQIGEWNRRDPRKRFMNICRFDIFQGGIRNELFNKWENLLVRIQIMHLDSPLHWEPQLLLTFLHLLTLLVVSVLPQSKSLTLVWPPLLPAQQKTQWLWCSGPTLPDSWLFHHYQAQIKHQTIKTMAFPSLSGSNKASSTI